MHNTVPLLCVATIASATAAFATPANTAHTATLPPPATSASRPSGDHFSQQPTVRAPCDTEIEYRVEEQIARLTDVDSSDVHVRSVRRAVTLYGTVPDEIARQRILVAAQQSGAVVVRDELSVRSPEQNTPIGPRDDTSIETQARTAILREAGTWARSLRARSRNGVVTLHGRVATYRDAHKILRAVRNIPGVRAVQCAWIVNESLVITIDGDRT